MLGLGLGIWLPALGGGFSPLALFAASEQGAWLDPSDLSTLFQDIAGTTPVTAAGQSVALVLDKSGRGNHASQATAASRPIYGVEPSTGRRNLLTYSEDFSNAVWTKADSAITPDAVVAPDGSLTADRLVENTATAVHLVTQVLGFTPSDNATVTLSVYVKAVGRDFFWIETRTKAVTFPNVFFNLATGVVAATFNGASATITPVGGGWYRCTLTANVLTGAGTPKFTCGPGVAANSAGRTYLGDGSSGVYLWGAQYEVGATATSYQRVVSQYDVTEAGVPSVNYLYDDLVDDAINWTAPAGSYTAAWCDTAGTVTIQTAQALSGATDAMKAQNMVGYLAIGRALTAAETTNLTAWFKAKAGG